jgi:hypothetical protein
MIITITNRGSIVNITINGVSRLLNKRDLNTKFTAPFLDITYKHERIVRIENHADVIEPESESITDLENKISEIINTAPVSGGGGDDHPLI